jgi:hypothetical protein
MSRPRRGRDGVWRSRAATVCQRSGGRVVSLGGAGVEVRRRCRRVGVAGVDRGWRVGVGAGCGVGGFGVVTVMSTAVMAVEVSGRVSVWWFQVW